MKKLTLFLAALMIAGASFAGDGDGKKACCKKGENAKACCKKEAAAQKSCCQKKGCDKKSAKIEDVKEETTTAASAEKKSRS